VEVDVGQLGAGACREDEVGDVSGRAAPLGDGFLCGSSHKFGHSIGHDG
jgi:hypothetical protein